MKIKALFSIKFLEYNSRKTYYDKQMTNVYNNFILYITSGYPRLRSLKISLYLQIDATEVASTII